MGQIVNAVNLIIINDRNQVLLAKRAEDGKFKNCWSIPGGTVEHNETFEEALFREIKEELGCNVSWFKYFKSYFFEVKEFTCRPIYFFGEIDGEINLDLNELSEYDWFDLDDSKIFELDFAFNQNEILESFVEYKKRNSL
ncbi:MAG: NUDIX domain-containing protein [Nanoarchaeota archaeon]|nr:NUDIX domain-containing protein [Nanoarchaeota archaeon]